MANTPLTDKQKAFIAHRIAGLNNTQACEAAGYTKASAATTAHRLAKDPRIIKALKAAKTGGKSVEDVPAGRPITSHLKAVYSSPKELMEHVMNNPKFPDVIRMGVAKDLLPYYHPKVGEQGKKEKQKDAATNAVSRRAPLGAPPRLGVVQGGKS